MVPFCLSHALAETVFAPSGFPVAYLRLVTASECRIHLRCGASISTLVADKVSPLRRRFGVAFHAHGLGMRVVPSLSRIDTCGSSRGRADTVLAFF